MFHSTIDVALVKKVVEDLDPSLQGWEDEDDYRVAVVLLTALTIGTRVGHLASFTGYPTDFIALIRTRMIRAELWTGNDTCCDHWFPSKRTVDGIAFWRDVSVGTGQKTRQWSEVEGLFRYYPFSSSLRIV
jgi:hypothetical protein